MRRLLFLLPPLIFFVAVAAFGCFRIIDADLWLYLRTGEYIRLNGTVPRADIFSYTAAGRPWIDAHWFSQFALYLVYAASGPTGLGLLRCALVVSIFAVLYRCCRSFAGPATVIAVLTLALLTANDRFLMKPSLIALLLATCFVALLERSRLSRDRPPYMLLPLQLVWANAHPSFFLGPLLILIYLCDELLRTPRGNARSRNRLALTLALACGACLINPYGFALLVQPIRQLSSPLFSETLIPWKPASLSFPPLPSVLAFRIMLVICTASFLLNARRIRPAHLLTAAVFGYLACTSRRHMALFALLCAPGIAYNLGSAARSLASRSPRVARILRPATLLASCLFLILLVADVTTNSYYYRQRSMRRFGLGKSRIAFPDAAIDFLLSRGVRGRIFSNYEIGSYVAARLYPDHPVFIDGRNLVYGEELFRTYLAAMKAPAILGGLSEKYGISTLLLTHHPREVKPLVKALWESGRWRPVYADERAVVFFKEPAGESAPGSMDDLRASLLACNVKGVPSADPFPLAELRAGELFFTLGLNGCARVMFEQALERCRALPEAHNFLGVIAMQDGDRARAKYEFRKALSPRTLTFRYAEPRINLASVLLEEGDGAGAMDRALSAVRCNPSNPRAHGVLGLAYMRVGKPGEALREIRKAVALDPAEAEYRNNLGSAYEQMGDIQKAMTEYSEACSLANDYFAPRFNLARLQALHGDLDSALESYLEALSLNPRHTGARKNLAVLYARSGEWRKARREIEEVLRIEPGDRAARLIMRKIEERASNKKRYGAY